jgi:hypothetical protein
MPATRSGFFGRAQAASSSIAKLKASALLTMGVMSLKTIPGLGKSGTSTMKALRSMVMGASGLTV